MCPSDLDELGRLLHAAYVGTVDYEGESEADARAAVAATFDGEFGAFVPQASVVLEVEGRLASAAFITLWQGRPLLAFTVTRPEFRGRGLARLCVAASMQALAAGGSRELDLFVTETNTSARALYERLGFVAASTS